MFEVCKAASLKLLRIKCRYYVIAGGSAAALAAQMSAQFELFDIPSRGSGIVKLLLPRPHDELFGGYARNHSPARYSKLKNTPRPFRQNVRRLSVAMRILVLEDDDLVREYVEVCLAEEGHQVISAGDAESAIDRLNSDECPDLLLSDFSLGGALDGVDVASEFLRQHPGSHVLLTSGNPIDAREKLEKTLDQGTFLPKPFLKTDLLAAVQRAMLSPAACRN
jgi:CheY-like chemotaxis protein